MAGAVFPKATLREKLENATARALWLTRVRAEREFWKHCEGSRVQAISHRLRDKNRAAS
jgi:hypothetical protein